MFLALELSPEEGLINGEVPQIETLIGKKVTTPLPISF